MCKIWNFISNRIIIGSIHLIFNIRVKGIKNVYNEDNFIFAFNHYGFIDFPVVIGILRKLKRKFRPLVGEELFEQGLVTNVMKVWNPIKLIYSKKSKSTEKCVNTLKDGKDLLIAPEGGYRWCRPNLKREKIFTGTVRISIISKKKIIPVKVTNCYEAWKFNYEKPFSIFRINPFKPILVEFLKPINSVSLNLDLSKFTEENNNTLKSESYKLIKQLEGNYARYIKS